jgi:hypothetical protein
VVFKPTISVSELEKTVHAVSYLPMFTGKSILHDYITQYYNIKRVYLLVCDKSLQS